MPLCSLPSHQFYPAIGFTAQERYPHSLPVSTTWQQSHPATNFLWKDNKLVMVHHQKLDRVSEQEEAFKHRRRRPSSMASLPGLMETIFEEEDE